jgi:ABC-type branched-subunit amino acid transport system substrate-binding protein
MKTICALFKTLAALLTVALLASTGLAQDTVKLGINEVRSGAFTTNGDRVVWGVEAAVKEANAAGGLLGKKIELVIEDNQLKGEIAVQKLKKMILEDNCQIIIQGSSSGVGGAIAQQMPRYKRIYLCTNAEAMAITGENFTPYTFRTCPACKGSGQVLRRQGLEETLPAEPGLLLGLRCRQVLRDVCHPIRQ